MDKALIQINELKKKIEEIDVELKNLNHELYLFDSELDSFKLEEIIKLNKKHLEHLKRINKRKIITLITLISSFITIYHSFLHSAPIYILSDVYGLAALIGGCIQLLFLIEDSKEIKHDGPNYIKINNEIEEAQKKLKEYEKIKNKSKEEVLQEITNKNFKKTLMTSEIEKLRDLRVSTIEEFMIEKNELDSIINKKYEEYIKDFQQTNKQFNDANSKNNFQIYGGPVLKKTKSISKK